MPSIVYVLVNKAMPGILKIGLTADSIETRMAALNSTGVPLPFECHYAVETDDAERLERTLHRLFSDVRVNPKREFFRVDPEKVVTAISIGGFREITPGKLQIEPEEQEALDRIASRRPRINMTAIGILPGTLLTFSRDDNVTATVTEDGKVQYNGVEMSLSAAALRALHAQGSRAVAASGSEYWAYEGELLDERRRRIEDETFASGR